jgi:antirestriction protein
MAIDWVKINAVTHCPFCGNVLSDWQTNERSVRADLSTLPFQEVNKFYNRCGNCSAYIEMNYAGKNRTIKDYILTAKYWSA